MSSSNVHLSTAILIKKCEVLDKIIRASVNHFGFSYVSKLKYVSDITKIQTKSEAYAHLCYLEHINTFIEECVDATENELQNLELGPKIYYFCKGDKFKRKDVARYICVFYMHMSNQETKDCFIKGPVVTDNIRDLVNRIEQ